MSLIQFSRLPRRTALVIGPLAIWLAWPPVRWHGRRGWYDRLYVSEPTRGQEFSKVFGPFYWRSDECRVE